MLQPLLHTFLVAADTGSFAKVAEQLYISPTAVMKQMNQLENEVGVQLFVRTSRGVSLTKAGESFYRDAKKIVKLTEDAIQRAVQADEQKIRVIRLGTSILYPCNQLIDLWNRISGVHPEFQLQIVSFDDSKRNFGTQFDILVGAHDSFSYAGQKQIVLGQLGFGIAVPLGHPLANRKKLTLTDLHGERLMIMYAGHSPANDRIRTEIEHRHPEITLEDVPVHYDMQTFNNCVSRNSLLLTLENWHAIHPSLVTIPLDVPYTIPNVILCQEHPGENTERFLTIVRETVTAG